LTIKDHKIPLTCISWNLICFDINFPFLKFELNRSGTNVRFLKIKLSPTFFLDYAGIYGSGLDGIEMFWWDDSSFVDNFIEF